MADATLLAQFRRMARYNRWANGRLYDACARLPEAEYLKPRPSFFGSIHRTLNHILVGDRIWLDRMEGRNAPAPALDAVLYEDLAGLLAAREAEDGRILAFVDGLDETAMAGEFAYRTSAGEAQANRIADVLPHLFNHETHHRGQVHGLLSQTEVAPLPLDLIYFMREAGA